MSVLVVYCLFFQSVCLVCSRGNACLLWRWLEGKFKGRWFVAVVGSDPENWLKGNRESREGSRTAYLVFWQVWLVLSRLCLPHLGVGTPWWGKGRGHDLWDLQKSWMEGRGTCSWCCGSVLMENLRTGSGVTEIVGKVNEQPIFSSVRCGVSDLVFLRSLSQWPQNYLS